jgi:hypothetical protein
MVPGVIKIILYCCSFTFWKHIGIIGINLKNSGALVRQQTIPTERTPLVGEVSANFSG